MKKASLLIGKAFIISLIIVFLGSISISKVFAGDIVINEFVITSTQWVELYNKGSSSVDISGWFIDDNGGTEKYTIPAGTTIAPSEFKVFESSSFNFNTASADMAQLINGSSVVDSYSYSQGPNGASYGRQSDGSNTWVAFASSTKGSSNNSSTVVPTPTFTPSPTPTPSNTPTPQNTPTPTKTPTPGATSTPTKTPTATPVVQTTNTPTPKVTTTIVSKSPTGSTLGSSTKSAVISFSRVSPTKKPKPTVTVSGAQSTKDMTPLLFIGGGIILLLGCGILTFWPQIKMLWKKE